MDLQIHGQFDSATSVQIEKAKKLKQQELIKRQKDKAQKTESEQAKKETERVNCNRSFSSFGTKILYVYEPNFTRCFYEPVYELCVHEVMK